MSQQSLIGCLGRIMPPDPPAALPPFLHQLHGGHEEVVQRPPRLRVERVDRGEERFALQAPVAQELP